MKPHLPLPHPKTNLQTTPKTASSVSGFVLIWDWLSQKFTERSPSIAKIVDQQLLLWNCSFDLGNILIRARVLMMETLALARNHGCP